MTMFSLNSVKARLLLLLLLISLPVFTLAVTLATFTYRSEIRAIEQARITTADEYAIRTRIWLRGVLRSVEVVLGNLPSTEDNSAQCQSLVSSVLKISPNYKAIQVAREKHEECHAALDNFISAVDMKALMKSFRKRPDTATWVPTIPGRFRYDAIKIQDRIYFAVYLRNVNEGGENVEGMIILEPDALDQLFDLGSVNHASIVGLVANGSDVLAVRGTSETNMSWLPKQWPSPEMPLHWTGVARSGLTANYAARFVAEKDIAVVAHFDGVDENMALRLFIAMALAPILILAMMYLASWRFIESNIVQGIAGIEKAAKAESAGHKAVVPIDPKMPDDIRNVAEAFNRMVNAAASREASLVAALQLNQSLMRELHHRVKNSLQVIQSYLALTRRGQPDRGGEILRDAEAKVQVLAVAYRLALTDEGMQIVPLEPFISELLSSMSDAAKRSNQTIVADIRTDAALPVDRAIPLGLAIVEKAFASLQSPSCKVVRVVLEKADDQGLHLVISADGVRPTKQNVSRTLLGLQTQLGATSVPSDPSILLHWRVALD